MSLAPGTKLGPYEILSPLGAGGMGEVYRARDTRLGREVAIKVLSSHLSASTELRVRLEREAKTVSSLNHPNICTLFDVGRAPGEAGSGGTDYLVMELIEGETLAQRLARGPLPGADVLRLGAQIADALDRAHRAGVIHRDLKPGNVMLAKSGAKLMDFGLARVAAPRGTGSGASPADLTQSPTHAARAGSGAAITAEGTLVGTFQYMSPEQLEGREADARSDLWGLGCLLYEMATGRRAFGGATQASLIGAIMRDTPRPISELVALAPPALERLVGRCLEKDPDDRWQSARDVAHELQWIAEAGSKAGVPAQVAAKRRGRERLAWSAATVALAAALGFGWLAIQPRLRSPELFQAILDPPPGALLGEYAGNVVLSPDGRAVAFAAGDSAGVLRLWVRPLDSESAKRLSAEPASWPFWSPDGKHLGYFDVPNGKLMQVEVAGGSPTILCEARNGRGGTWNRDGTILFAPNSYGPLMRVSRGGGTPVPATTLDSSRHERSHRFPQFLPDGDHFLFASLPGTPAGWDIWVGSLRSGTVKRIMSARSTPVYAEPGYLLFEKDGRVMAQRFDPRRLELAGVPVALCDAPPRTDMDAEPVVSVSRNDRMVLLRTPPVESHLEVLDRTGATRRSFDLPREAWQVVKAAPDGRRALVLNGKDLWIVDLDRSVPMRLASSSSSLPSAVWSPDGSRIAYTTGVAGRDEIHIVGPDGRTEVVPTTEDAYKGIADWSPDGRFIVFTGLSARTSWDLWLLPLDGERKPVPYLAGPSWEVWGRVSPDGRWLAYQSDETGQSEIYVQSFPQPGRKVRVSPDGGLVPTWARGGRELVYLRGRTVHAVPVEAAGDLRPGTPRPLFTISDRVTRADAFADGERYLVSFADVSRPNDIRLLVNWKELIER